MNRPASNPSLPSASLISTQALMGIRYLHAVRVAGAQSCNLRAVEVTRALLKFQRPAECNSAIQQVANLRYSR